MTNSNLKTRYRLLKSQLLEHQMADRNWSLESFERLMKEDEVKQIEKEWKSKGLKLDDLQQMEMEL